MKFQKKLSAISLGQGQGPRAEAMMRQAMDRGRWVFFQNCHLSPSWMPTLERLIEQIDGDKVMYGFYKVGIANVLMYENVSIAVKFAYCLYLVLIIIVYRCIVIFGCG